MIRIDINTYNAAFDEGNCAYEVARILRELADTAESDGIYYEHVQQIKDISGNVVGTMSTKEV